MREIKFRAWDKKNKRMLRLEDVGGECWADSYYGEYSELWNSDLGNFFDCLDSIGEDEDVILMQYTGLKDKNGKEIYEGDIVGIYWVGEERELTWFVEWDSKSASFCLRQTPGSKVYTQPYISASPTFINDLQQTAIIGNIYENPELLAKEM